MSDILIRQTRAFNYRWTVRGVDPRLVRRLKIEAIEHGLALSTMVNEALTEYLQRKADAGDWQASS